MRRVSARHALGATITAFVLALCGSAQPAGAALPSGPAPLPGSTFQGGDGNQDDVAGSVDWQGLETAGSVVHSPDPNGADTEFVNGTSKEENPGAWDLTTQAGGVTPGKANILDAWSSVDQPGPTTFLYLGFTRAEANGDTILAAELNQDARLWNNGKANIPCRRTGDLLAVLDAGGNSTDMILQRWTTSATDPATGCAAHGTLTTVATIPAGSAQGNVNGGAITSHLPGAFAPGASIPEAHFAEASLNLTRLLDVVLQDRCAAFGSIWMHSRSSFESLSSNMQDYVAPRALAMRTCAASGTKFFDRNANGVRDPGEPGLPRFVVFADYNGDGIRQSGEPFTVTDAQGQYVLEDIRPPGGTYTLRETLLPALRGTATAWTCSFPHAGTPGGFDNGLGGLFSCGWGPIDVDATPNATGKDFGDWIPAQLTLQKELFPADDPGRFDLKVNGTTELAGAGDGASVTIDALPGRYTVSEAAVPPTDPAAYRSTVICQVKTTRRGVVRAGTAFESLVLQAGDHAACTFVNVRPGVPAISLEKTAPAIATAGDELRYGLLLRNLGDVAFPAAAVVVSDPSCDAPPALFAKTAAGGGTDATPQTFDPGDVWTYRCTTSTTAPAADCQVTTVTNTATATATPDGGTSVSDDASQTTTLRCPDKPPEPPLPTPTPEPTPTPPLPVPDPGTTPSQPVVPPGPRPPEAGRAGVAGLIVRAGRCISRASQARVVGTHMRVLRVSLDGRRVRLARIRVLQRRSAPLRGVLTPGRHRVAVRVAFENGSGTPAVTLRRTIVVCGRAAARRPNFTG